MSKTKRKVKARAADRQQTGKYGPFAVLRFALHVEYYPTEKSAVRRLKKLQRFERVALVDRQTGWTRCRRTHYHVVTERLLKEGTAPAEFDWRPNLGAYLRYL